MNNLVPKKFEGTGIIALYWNSELKQLLVKPYMKETYRKSTEIYFKDIDLLESTDYDYVVSVEEVNFNFFLVAEEYVDNHMHLEIDKKKKNVAENLVKKIIES